MCGALGRRDYGVVFVLGLMVFRLRGAGNDVKCGFTSL